MNIPKNPFDDTHLANYTAALTELLVQLTACGYTREQLADWLDSFVLMLESSSENEQDSSSNGMTVVRIGNVEIVAWAETAKVLHAVFGKDSE